MTFEQKLSQNRLVARQDLSANGLSERCHITDGVWHDLLFKILLYWTEVDWIGVFKIDRNVRPIFTFVNFIGK